MNDRTVQLCFVLGRGITSAAIAWFSAGHLSHVDAILPNGQLYGARSDRTGGMPSGVWLRPAGYELVRRSVTAEIPCDRAQRAEWLRWLAAQRGKPYDHLAILGFAVGRNWRDEGSWFCSELQARALEVAGIAPRLYLAANKITPAALALVVSALPGARIEAAGG